MVKSFVHEAIAAVLSGFKSSGAIFEESSYEGREVLLLTRPAAAEDLPQRSAAEGVFISELRIAERSVKNSRRAELAFSSQIIGPTEASHSTAICRDCGRREIVQVRNCFDRICMAKSRILQFASTLPDRSQPAV